MRQLPPAQQMQIQMQLMMKQGMMPGMMQMPKNDGNDGNKKWISNLIWLSIKLCVICYYFTILFFILLYLAK